MGKRFAAVGLAGAIGLGGLGVAALNPLGTAGADAGRGTTETTLAGQPGQAGRAGRDGPLKRALDKLVADGTLTQAQADTVLSTTKAEAETGRTQRKERRATNRQEVLAAAATAIGSTPDDVKSGLQAGTSIAAQAKAKGVERSVVEEAVTKVLTDRIDAAVKAGTITEEQAAKAKGRLDKVVDRILDADGHRLGQGGSGRQRRGN